MTELVTLLSTGKGTWAEAAKVITSQEWGRIFLITNDFGKNTLQKKENMEFIIINTDDPIEQLIESLLKQMKSKINGPEVALNLISGTGKEHMAILSSLLKLGVGIRLVTSSHNGIKEI